MNHRPNETPTPGALLNRQEAAALLRVSVKTVDRLRERGHLEAVTVGSRVLFRPEAVTAFIITNSNRG